MLAKLQRFFKVIGEFLNKQYHRKPGCCASGGMSVSEMEGRRPASGEIRRSNP